MSKTSPLRIIFAGTPVFSAIHLQGILDAKEHDVIAVYSQPDRPSGRGKKLTQSPVKELALKNNIPVYQPTSLKDASSQKQLKSLDADIMVVVAYGLILPSAVLQAPKFGCINVHASLLPRWRGAAPIQRAIEAGDNESGVIIMQMDEGLDTGNMLLEARCNISDSETYSSLHDKLASIGVPSLNEALNLISAGHTNPTIQDDNLSCYATKITKEDAIILWDKPADVIERKIRAFNPFPVAYAILNGERIKIWQAKANMDEQKGQQHSGTGTILQADKQGIIVSCGKGTLTLKQIQLPGKKALNIIDILNSKAAQFSVGTRFDSISSV